MALNKATLETSFLITFSDMESDSDFASGIASACKSYVESGTVTTIDSGTISSGVFAGSGSGSASVSDSLMSAQINTAIAQMKQVTSGGDNILANGIFNGLKAMLAQAQVSTNVKGNVTQGSSSSYMEGTASGTGITCTDAGFVSSLLDCFDAMKNKTSGGDSYFASQLADIIDTYVSTGKVTTQGQGTLEGSAGSGSIA